MLQYMVRDMDGGEDVVDCERAEPIRGRSYELYTLVMFLVSWADSALLTIFKLS